MVIIGVITHFSGPSSLLQVDLIIHKTLKLSKHPEKGSELLLCVHIGAVHVLPYYGYVRKRLTDVERQIGCQNLGVLSDIYST